MRAVAVFPGDRRVALIEQSEPLIAAPGEVKLRMLEVGVCGTDRDLCTFKFGSCPPGFDHFVLGHESLAEVAEVGAAVTTVRPGDLAVLGVRKPCTDPSCAACRSGRQDFCRTSGYAERGIKDLHGCMTGYVVEDERYVYPLPPDLREVGVLAEPLTIAEKAFLQFTAIEQRLPWSQPRRTAVVLGAGPVGLLGAMLFQHAGFDTWVYSRERAPDRRPAIVAAIGARYVSTQDATAAEFARAAGNIDVVYEAMGAPQAAFDVLRHLGANGVFIFTGVPREGDLALDLHDLLLRMILKNHLVLGTVNAGPDAFAAAVRDLTVFERRWPAALRRLLSGRYPIEAYSDALWTADSIKNVIAL